jgi:hypothetical protein
MFCVVMVRDVQPEIRPEVTRKLRKSFENRGLPGCHGSGAVAADWAICETGMRSRFHVNESSFRLAACAPLSGKPAKGFGVTAAAADLLFWSRNPPSQGYGAAGYLLAALAAATILSKCL